MLERKTDILRTKEMSNFRLSSVPKKRQNAPFISLSPEATILMKDYRNSLMQNLIQLITPPKQSTFGIHDPKSLKFLTRLRVEFSDLHEHFFGTISGIIVHIIFAA